MILALCQLVSTLLMGWLNRFDTKKERSMVEHLFLKIALIFLNVSAVKQSLPSTAVTAILSKPIRNSVNNEASFISSSC